MTAPRFRGRARPPSSDPLPRRRGAHPASRSGTARAARPLAGALLALAGTLFLSAPAEAQTPATLVSNIEQSGFDGTNQNPTAQNFYTATSTAGYVLTGIDVVSSYSSATSTALLAEVCTTDASDGFVPTSRCTALTTPTTFDVGTVSLTAPANTRLAEHSTYTVVVRHEWDFSYADTADVDTGNAAGWSIASAGYYQRGEEWYGTVFPLKIGVKGYARTGPIATPEVEIEFAAAGHEVDEGASATVVVNLDQAPERMLTVPLVRFNGPGAADADLTAPEDVTFAATDTSATFTVTATDNSAYDGPKYVDLYLGDELGIPPDGVSFEDLYTSATSTRISIVDDDAPRAAFTGMVAVGSTLTADTSGIGDAGSVPGYTYQWKRLAGGQEYDDGTALATTATYTPVEADRGHMLVLRVSYTDADDAAATLDAPRKAVPLERAVWSAVLEVGELTSGGAGGLGYSSQVETSAAYGSLDEPVISRGVIEFTVLSLRFGTSSAEIAFPRTADPGGTELVRMGDSLELRVGEHSVEVNADARVGSLELRCFDEPCAVDGLRLYSSDPIDDWEVGRFWPLYLVEVPRVSIAASYDEAISGIDDLEFVVRRAGPGADAALAAKLELTQDAEHVGYLFATDDTVTFDADEDSTTVRTEGGWGGAFPTAEGDVTVRVQDLVGYNAISDTDPATVTMRWAEHPYEVRIDADEYRFPESAGTPSVVLYVRTGENLPMPRTVQPVAVAASAGTAVSPGDYAVLSVFADIEPSAFSQSGTRYEASVPVALTIVDDAIAEDEESFEVALQKAPGGSLAVRLADYQWEDCTGDCRTDVHIDDDDVRGIAVEPAAPRVVEEDTATYRVALTSQPTATTTVTVAGHSGTDLGVSPETLTFSPYNPQLAMPESNWSVWQTVTLTAAADDDSASEEVVLTHTATATAGDYMGLNVAKAVTVTVVDDDLPQLAVADAAAVVEGGNAEFAVTLSAAAAAAVTVDWAVSGDTATVDDDFEADSGTLTFAAGDTTETVTVTTLEDLLDEEDEETFTLTLSNASSNAAVASPTATATITDDDDPPEVRVADATAAEGGTVSFAVMLTAPSGLVATVDWETTADTAEADDFTAATSTLTFAAGQTVRTVDVATTADTDGDDETFTLTLSVPTNATFAGGATMLAATGTIADTPRLDVDDVTVDEGGDAVFAVTLSRAAPAEVTVAWALSDGTATAGEDFDAGSGTLTFAPGDTRRTARVATTADDLDEGAAETFTLTLSMASSNVVLEGGGATLTATGTITDDDDPPALAVADAAAGEGEEVEFAVELSAPSGLEVTVAWATSAETGDTAEADDFEADSGTLTFAAGDTRRTVTVPTTRDADNDDETFTLTLSNPVNATLPDATATGTVVDLPRLSVAGASAWEGEAVEFAVELTRRAPAAVTVDWRASAGPGDTAEDDDLARTSGRLTIGEGFGAGTVRVRTNHDADAEDETFTLTLSNATNTTFAGGAATLEAAARIVDDERPAAAVTVVDVVPVVASDGVAVGAVNFKLSCPDCPTSSEATLENSDPVTGVWFDVVAMPNHDIRVWQSAADEAAGCAPIVETAAGGVLAKATYLANFGHLDTSSAILSLVVDTLEPCNGRVYSFAFAAAEYTLEVQPWNRSLRAGPAWVVDTRDGFDEFTGGADTGGTGTGGADTGGADTGGTDTGGTDTGGTDTGGADTGGTDTGGGTSAGTSGGSGSGGSGGSRDRPPVVTEEIVAQVLERGASVTLDALQHFRDPERRALTFTAESADPAVATVTVDDAAVTIAGVEHGHTRVTLTATDRRRQQATQEFAVRVGRTVSFADAQVSAPEGGTVELTVTIDRALEEATTLSYVVGPDADPATVDADAADHAGRDGTVTIEAGATAASLDIAVYDDADIEAPRETFAVTLLRTAEQAERFGLGAATARVTIMEGVCDRTAQVRNTLRRSLPCAAVSAADLAALREVDLAERGIAALRGRDLSGLTGLRVLDLSENLLTALPAGVFEGLGPLDELQLQDNPGAPFALTVHLSRVDADVSAPGPARVLAGLAEGAPLDVRVAVTATHATLSADAAHLAAGALASAPLRVTGAGTGAARLTATAPALPDTRCGLLGLYRCYRGVTLTAGAPLVLFKAPPRATGEPPRAELGTDGDALRIDLSDLFAASDGGALTYAARSSDPGLVAVHVTGGVLTVASTPDGAEGTATVTVTATDADGLSATRTFEVTVEPMPGGLLRGWRRVLLTRPAPAERD